MPGTVIGPRIGAPTSTGGGIAGVSRDVTSGWYCPVSAAEWTIFMTAIGLATGNPSFLWLCQEASGNLVSSIGTATLVANASPLYQQPIAGWTRTGIGFTNTAAQRFLVGAGTGPNPATGSVLWLAYLAVTGTLGATDDMIVVASGANPLKMRQSNGAARMNVLDNATSTTSAVGLTTAVQPFILKFDRTNAACTAYNGQEKLTTVYDATVADASKGFGAATGSAFIGNILYSAAFTLGAAELSDAQVKVLANGLTNTVMPWS